MKNVQIIRRKTLIFNCKGRMIRKFRQHVFYIYMGYVHFFYYCYSFQEKKRGGVCGGKGGGKGYYLASPATREDGIVKLLLLLLLLDVVFAGVFFVELLNVRNDVESNLFLACLFP